jgi:hypothetical protein
MKGKKAGLYAMMIETEGMRYPRWQDQNDTQMMHLSIHINFIACN